MLAPGTALLSPRGKVLENGMPRWFRRIREGVFDEKDLIARSGELARFIAEAATAHGFDPARVIAVGFSNGANIAAALHLLHPTVLRGSILFRAMVPLTPTTSPDLTGVPVFISAGREDPLIPPENAERVASILRDAGAEVTLSWEPSGHSLVQHEVVVAREWFGRQKW
jgi:predicted esterase